MSGFSTKEVNLRSRYTCIRTPPISANPSLLQRIPTILRLLLSKVALRPPWSPPPPWPSAALAAAMISSIDSYRELFLWRSVSGRFSFNWSQGDLRAPWIPASARVRPPSTRRYGDPIRSRSSRWLHADLGWLLRTRYRLQLTPGCARRQKHHRRPSSNRKPKFKFKIAKLGKLHSSELRCLGLLLCSLSLGVIVFLDHLNQLVS